ncbi:twitching mobility protein [Mariprofundus micogutta]|uniref:Twitching mobility protein n=1 Tax=Mariprofundus micogutta TaxID=1921010 RepID=A0A1L8CNP1_9PROT|nr:PilT/PilU family type 4a pilus ATPase [Mariprofundus micogutta]GAV20540.1 twitching mobility protein [Mariprofundus micogutta]
MANRHLIDELLLVANKNGASDLIVRTGDRVRMRINGAIVTVSPDRIPEINQPQAIDMIQHLLHDLPYKPDTATLKSFDFHYSLANTSHFRIHIMRTNNNFGIVARLIPQKIPEFEELRLPQVFNDIIQYRNGIILMAGAAGSGKSTSLAAMLNHIIQQRPVHAVTLEDPIEFRYGTKHKGTVSQREIGMDVESYKQGLVDAMRETPNIIVAGEARGREEIQLAIEASETGHLVMATVHATTAIGTMQRIMASFGKDEQAGIRERLAENLRAIIVQKLLPLKNGKGRIVALEIMIKNSVIKHFILDQDHWSEIPRAMEEGFNLYGSQNFDQHLQLLVENDLIDYEEAVVNAVFPEDFAIRMGHD